MERVPLERLPDIAQAVLAALPKEKGEAVIVALEGELGAGKTAFTQTLAKELGVSSVVQSPTYVLMKKYSIEHKNGLFKTLMHIDAYRFENKEQFAALRPEEFLQNPETLILIEWPERVFGALPKPDVTVRFSSKDAQAGERYIEIV